MPCPPPPRTHVPRGTHPYERCPVPTLTHGSHVPKGTHPYAWHPLRVPVPRRPQAMHSERILIFEPETSKLRRSGVGNYGNAFVAIKRRYNNVLVDTDKQYQIELFLGLKANLYFSKAYLPYRCGLGVGTRHCAYDLLYIIHIIMCVCVCVCCLREVRGRAGSLGRRAYTHHTPKPV